MWLPGWEGSLGENGYMHMYGWVPSLFTWNCHNIVNWLYPIQNRKFKRKKKGIQIVCMPQKSEVHRPSLNAANRSSLVLSLHLVHEVKWSESCSAMSDSLQPHGLYSPGNSPGQNTLVGCCSLLKAVFLTQGSNWGLLHCRQILYQLNHHGRPRILEWLAYPFSSISSQPRNWTRVSCIAGRFFTSWATTEAPTMCIYHVYFH